MKLHRNDSISHSLPLKTQPYQMEEPRPTSTWPMTDALGATNASLSTTGTLSNTFISVRCRDTEQSNHKQSQLPNSRSPKFDSMNEIKRIEIECSNWGHTLLLEVVTSLEARAEAIDGLAGFADPESDGVDCSSDGPHLRRSELEVSGECELRGESRFLSLSWGCESKALSFFEEERELWAFDKMETRSFGKKGGCAGLTPSPTIQTTTGAGRFGYSLVYQIKRRVVSFVISESIPICFNFRK